MNNSWLVGRCPRCDAWVRIQTLYEGNQWHCVKCGYAPFTQVPLPEPPKENDHAQE